MHLAGAAALQLLPSAGGKVLSALPPALGRRCAPSCDLTPRTWQALQRLPSAGGKVKPGVGLQIWSQKYIFPRRV